MDLSQILSTPAGNMFQGLILPFLLIFAILWGILGALNIFKNRKVDLVLSLGLAMISVFTPQFELFTQMLAQLGGQIAIYAFFAVFGFGVVMWALRRGYDITVETTGLSKDQLRKKISKLREQYRDAMDDDNRGKMSQLREEIKRLEMELELK